jgi:hypothetical protein
METESFFFEEKIISKDWEKIHLTVYVDNKYACAKSIFIDCNKAIISKFDFQSHTQVCVVANYKAPKKKTRCHVKILLPHPMQTVITIVVIIQNFI